MASFTGSESVRGRGLGDVRGDIGAGTSRRGRSDEVDLGRGWKYSVSLVALTLGAVGGFFFFFLVGLKLALALSMRWLR